MHFEAIRDFEWFNEPDFRFISGALEICSASKTDFWQDMRRGIHKDNGHFFHNIRRGNFTLDVKWQMPHTQPRWSQCGLLGRINEKNWCKIAVVAEDDSQRFAAVSVTHLGCSDLALVRLDKTLEAVTFRLRLSDGVFTLAYSPDGQNFIAVRRFQMLVDFDDVAAGAYICSPYDEKFTAVLTDINLY